MRSSRFLELSQNVYRSEDVTRNGIIGCLTPTGIPFSTVEGRRIAGREALILQGLPVEQLDLSRLSQSRLRDLAGNAMTSTVVGAVMFAGLVQFSQLFSPRINVRTDVWANVISEILRPIDKQTLLTRKTSNPFSYIPISANRIKVEAEKTVRICFCEGVHGFTKAALLKCEICNHTACEDCGKNPKHNYSKFTIPERKDPIAFERLLKRSIPKMLRFTKSDCGTFYSLLHGDSTETWRLVIGNIRKAISDTVYLRNIRRAEYWEAIFDSAHAKLQLKISPQSVEWLAYAQVSSQVPGNSPDRLYLAEHPFARMRPINGDICQGVWEFWLPQLENIPATVSVPEDASLIPSFHSTRGLDCAGNSRVWNAYCVRFDNSADIRYVEHNIQGRYQSSQVCGQAFNSLHVKRSQDGLRTPIFLYLDHKLRTGDPSKHAYVFTLDKTRLRQGEYRPHILAQLPCTWRPPMVYGLPINGLEVVSKPAERVTLQVDGRFIPFLSLSFNFSVEQSIEYGHAPVFASNNYESQRCDGRDVFFKACNGFGMEVDDIWARDKWIVIDGAKEFDFKANFGWMIDQGLHTDGHSRTEESWKDKLKVADASNCETCAPTPPPLLWTSVKRGLTERVTAVEDPEMAARFERLQKCRPSALITFLHISTSGIVNIQIEINRTALVHRALSQLGLTGRLKEVEISWRLVTDDITTRQPVLKQFILKGNNVDNCRLVQRPQFSGQFHLREDQEGCVAWMIRQERRPTIFSEEEVVEVRAKHLGYRAEGRATRGRLIRGGIQAHEVGFGKTITTLALIDCQREIDIAMTPEKLQGYISVKATVIFVPSHLHGQWEREVEKFLPVESRGRVVVIKSIQNLRLLSIGDIQAANIIIINWSILESKIYMDNLAEFAGMVEPVDSSSLRAKYTWYNEALKAIAQNTDLLRERAVDFKHTLEQQYNKNLAMADTVKIPVSSKRRRGAAYQAWRAKQIQMETSIRRQKHSRDEFQNPIPETAINIENEWTRWKAPVLEIFKFARIVIDEFTYLPPNVRMILENIKSHCCWALSGTPPLGSFADVKCMARLIGIKLGVDDYASMKSDVVKATTKEFTSMCF